MRERNFMTFLTRTYHPNIKKKKGTVKASIERRGGVQKFKHTKMLPEVRKNFN